MSNSTTENSLGLGTVLFLIFMVLKLTGTINWSWWWVTSPLWIPLVVVLGIVAIAAIIATIAVCLGALFK